MQVYTHTHTHTQTQFEYLINLYFWEKLVFCNNIKYQLKFENNFGNKPEW